MKKIIFFLLLSFALASAQNVSAGLLATLISVTYVDNGTSQELREHPWWILKLVDTETGETSFTMVEPAIRRPTGEGGTIGFGRNEAVVGGNITMADGRISAGPCYLSWADMDGQVTSGAINPWGAETDSREPCNWQTPAQPATTPAPSATAPTVNGLQRRQTGAGTGAFTKGEAVVAGNITMADGRTSAGPCYLSWADMDGTAKSGAINPWPGETTNVSACTWQHVQVTPAPSASPASSSSTKHLRRPTGSGVWLPFTFGDSVVGANVRYVDRFGNYVVEYHGCWVEQATLGGWVNSGVIWPDDSDLKAVGYTRCPPPYGY